jgi:hypothetical protein
MEGNSMVYCKVLPQNLLGGIVDNHKTLRRWQYVGIMAKPGTSEFDPELHMTISQRLILNIMIITPNKVGKTCGTHDEVKCTKNVDRRSWKEDIT